MSHFATIIFIIILINFLQYGSLEHRSGIFVVSQLIVARFGFGGFSVASPTLWHSSIYVFSQLPAGVENGGGLIAHYSACEFLLKCNKQKIIISN